MDLARVFGELGLPLFSLLILLGLALLFSAYIKLITVFSILRLGLGAAAFPPVFVTGAVSLALTLFIMYPVLERSGNAASQVLQEAGEVRTEAVRYRAIGVAATEWRGFLKQYAEPQLVKKFVEIATKTDMKKKKAGEAIGSPPSVSEDSWRILAPAFVITQLKQAFSIGLSVVLPFLLIDLIVATLLGALGLERLEPGYVALPAKILLFVIVDGWTLIATNLASTFQ